MVSPAKIKKVLENHKGMFIALEEMDRTGKLPRLSYKGRYNFTLDSELMKDFRAYCRKRNLKMSAKIEDMIKKELKTETSENYT